MAGFPNVTRPNVALIVFDSLSSNTLERHIGKLPALSALKDECIWFSKAYATSPESSPARASLFTSLDMAVHGLWTDGVALPRRETTISEVFSRNGYQTWLVGRRQLAGVANWTTEHARLGEFDSFDWAHGPLHRSRQNAYLTWLESKDVDRFTRIFPSQANSDDTNIPPWQREMIAELRDALCFNTWVGSQFCARLAEHTSTDPFLGIAGFVVGAALGAGSACFEALEERALRQADAALSKIIKMLPDDTVVVVTSGRGDVIDSTNRCPMPETAINTPLLIRMPGRDAKHVDAIVSNMDVAPTLYEIAQIKPPKRIQGRSLLTSPARGWALSRLRNPGLAHQTALCTEKWKLIMSQNQTDEHAPPSFCLYDLQADPDELHDLASVPAHQDDLEAMIDLMIDTRVALEDRTEPRIAKF